MSRLRADFILLMVALIWGSAFAVQRVAVQYFDAFTFNGLRFLLGGVVLLPFSQLNPFVKNNRGKHRITVKVDRLRWHILDRKSTLNILLAGSLLFGAAGLQQVGLETTTAGNAGFITTLYVVLVPIILTIFWGERIHWIPWLGAGMAIVGSLLLSTGGKLQLAAGDAFELAGAVFWALHLIVISRVVKFLDVLTFSSGQFLVAGGLNILISFLLQMSLGGLALGWWTIIYIGLISTTLGFTLQVFGQKYAPPTDTAIILSMEAVFAASAGFIFLRETMDLIQILGCGLILVAVLVIQLNSVKMRRIAIQE